VAPVSASSSSVVPVHTATVSPVPSGYEAPTGYGWRN